jgi:hypothetical protein
VKPPLKIRLDTPEDRALWETAKNARAEVESWPAWKRGDAYVTSAVPVPEYPRDRVAHGGYRGAYADFTGPIVAPEKPVADRFADVTEANPPLGIYSERELLEELLLRLARRK